MTTYIKKKLGRPFKGLDRTVVRSFSLSKKAAKIVDSKHKCSKSEWLTKLIEASEKRS